MGVLRSQASARSYGKRVALRIGMKRSSRHKSKNPEPKKPLFHLLSVASKQLEPDEAKAAVDRVKGQIDRLFARNRNQIRRLSIPLSEELKEYFRSRAKEVFTRPAPPLDEPPPLKIRLQKQGPRSGDGCGNYAYSFLIAVLVAKVLSHRKRGHRGVPQEIGALVGSEFAAYIDRHYGDYANGEVRRLSGLPFPPKPAPASQRNSPRYPEWYDAVRNEVRRLWRENPEHRQLALLNKVSACGRNPEDTVLNKIAEDLRAKLDFVT